VSFFFGGVILAAGVFTLLKLKPPISLGIEPILKKISGRLTHLILMDRPLPVFLFGFFTLALPCGQTVIVFSALALEGSLLSGLANGCFFALLTSPSLFLAMRAQNYFRKFKEYTPFVLGICTVIVGAAALCRGLAETGVIPHLVLNPGASPEYHIALY
jgi:sulfite exporter TauE/SafE